MKMTVVWEVAPCSLVDIDQRLAPMMEAVRFSENSVNIYQIARRNNSEDN
jgi:hypothetical protein